MQIRRRAWAALVLGCTFLCSSSALAEKRVALVIGNDSYQNLPALQKAVNDAEAAGNAFGRLGFSVIRGNNLTRQGIVDKLAEFTANLDPGDTAAFFYAGHGVAINGVNYVVPVDVPAAAESAEVRVRGASIAEQDVIAEIQAKGTRVTILVLDACRDNPFPHIAGRSIGNARGLADAKPVRGVFTFYSAGIGQIALDRLDNGDPNRNSIFTRVFVDQIIRPGLHLGDIAVEVRERVAELALQAKDSFGQPAPHEQTPAYYDQTLGGRIFLAGLPKEPAGAIPPSNGAGAAAADEVAWHILNATTDVSALRRFMAEFPTSRLVPEVEKRIEQLAPAQTGEKTVLSARQATVQTNVVTPARQSAPAPLTSDQESALKVGNAFKECSNCPQMIVVPPGSFIMGSPDREMGSSTIERPQHRVTFSSRLAVGGFPVSFDEWDACVGDGGCNGYRPPDEGWGRGDHPVINVSWDDAKAFTAWLSAKTGKTYRLLTEAEREYVARAGTTTPYWWGSTIWTDSANYDGRSSFADVGETRGQTSPVNSFQPNRWGLYSVHGNVYEWSEDCYVDNYRDSAQSGSARILDNCSRRVLRGGSWASEAKNLRAAHRFDSIASTRRNDYGFRVAREIGH